jgi:hypothetical protein
MKLVLRSDMLKPFRTPLTPQGAGGIGADYLE